MNAAEQTTLNISIEQIKAVHVKGEDSFCVECRPQLWPCKTLRLVARIEKFLAEQTDDREAIHENH